MSNLCDKKIKIKTKAKAYLVILLSFLTLILPVVLLANIFQIHPILPFTGVLVIWCFTFFFPLMRAIDGIKVLNRQKESHRRKAPENIWYYRYRDNNTGEWDKWWEMDMDDKYFQDFYNDILKYRVGDDNFELEKGGMTEEQRKDMNRKKWFKNLLD